MKALFPVGNDTIYSAFVGCALLDCKNTFADLRQAGKVKTALIRLNLVDLAEVLRGADLSVCDSIRKEPRFDLEKFTIVY